MARPIAPQKFCHRSRSCGRCRGWPGRSGSPIWTWGSFLIKINILGVLFSGLKKHGCKKNWMWRYGDQGGQVPQYETVGQNYGKSVQSKRPRRGDDDVTPAQGKTAYCRRVTPQLGWDEVRQKVSQVKGEVTQVEGGIGYQKADPKTTHFPNFPTLASSCISPRSR